MYKLVNHSKTKRLLVRAWFFFLLVVATLPAPLMYKLTRPDYSSGNGREFLATQIFIPTWIQVAVITIQVSAAALFYFKAIRPNREFL